MKTVTPAQLVKAYEDLNPGEHDREGVDKFAQQSDILRTFANWLDRYGEFPEATLSVVRTSWGGKVTHALFFALGLKLPRTKDAMIKALSEPVERVGCYLYPTGIIYADKLTDDPATHDYKRLAYLNYGTLQLDLEPDLKGDLLAYVVEDAATIQARKGQPFQIAGNMTITLGDGSFH